MFKGSMVAIVTPMDREKNVDYPAFIRLLDWHIQAGTTAIIVAGTTGESATLTQEEQRHLFRFAVEHVRGRLPIIGGTGSTATAHAIKLTEMALEEGVDAVLLMAPAYVKPTQEGLYQHYRAIAEAVPIPQILYNVPGRTACDILPETVARLADLPNIVGIKEATGQIDRIKQILALCKDKIDIYSGDDLTVYEAMEAGAKGIISVTANIMPEAMHRLCTLALNGHLAEAQALQTRLLPLHKALFSEANPIPIKWALADRGWIDKGIRLPLTLLSEPYQKLLAERLDQLGIERVNVSNGDNLTE